MEEIITTDDTARSECAEHVKGECGYCSDEHMIGSYKLFLKRFDRISDGEDVIKKIKRYLDVKRESHIWEHPLFRAWYGDSEANDILVRKFKPRGPAHDTSLLSNFNIDETLASWERLSEMLFDKKLKHYSFHMIDFAKYNRELNNVDIKELMKLGYNALTCVLNTDVSTGRGKHWFCIYVDMMHTGDKCDPVVIEFFNSSGYQPRKEMVDWFRKVINTAKPLCVVYKKSLRKRIQFTNTECGVWCLAYIKSRLHDKEPEWFEKMITDDDIIKFRKHLFRDS